MISCVLAGLKLSIIFFKFMKFIFVYKLSFTDLQLSWTCFCDYFPLLFCSGHNKIRYKKRRFKEGHRKIIFPHSLNQ